MGSGTEVLHSIIQQQGFFIRSDADYQEAVVVIAT